ncbi:MAG: hypothetical protein Q8L90_08060, partial [Bacteroidota bacterium]|nr:hypothetical protein [Bacteroidota bacterium]
AAIIKGNSAYGCGNWKNGCNFRLPYEFMSKQLNEIAIQALIKNGETIVIKGFLKDGNKVNGKLKFDNQFNLSIVL